MPFPSTQQQAYMTYIQLWKHPRYTELFQFSQGTKTPPVSAIFQFSQTHAVHILYMRPTKIIQCKGLITEYNEHTIFENYQCHTYKDTHDFLPLGKSQCQLPYITHEVLVYTRK